MQSFQELQESLRMAEHEAGIYIADFNAMEQMKKNPGSDRKECDQIPKKYTPPKNLLLYMSNMGSLTSRSAVAPTDSSDETCEIPENLNFGSFLDWLEEQQPDAPPRISRKYISAPGRGGAVQTSTPFRVLQWNVLAQALGSQVDSFVRCPLKALEWDTRKYRMLEEILYHDPDIVCLQEVDHYRFLERALEPQGFKGHFVPKPDSPCIYLSENNGPDGCALFYRTERFKLKNIHTKTLEVWKVQSNQVALLSTLEDLVTNEELIVLTTHLKARKGALLSSFRDEQGGDLLKFLHEYQDERPAIICGDFNAEPTEPVYSRLTQPSTKLKSSYAVTHGNEEPPYSTWKIRKDGESKHTLDYIFYTDEKLILEGCLDLPIEEDVGEDRLPCLSFPSDHFYLVSDFSLVSKKSKNTTPKSRQ